MIKRRDIFTYRKEVHIKLDKETYMKFRGNLFLLDTTMQNVFEEFATLVANEDPLAIRIVERMLKRTVRQDVAEVAKDLVYTKKMKQKAIKSTASTSGMNHNALYDIISDDTIEFASEENVVIEQKEPKDEAV